MRSPVDLEQIHRLERMGWLAAGLTHDLNNALVCALAEVEALDGLVATARRALAAWPGFATEAVEALDAAARSVGTLRSVLDTTVVHSRDLQSVYRSDAAAKAGDRTPAATDLRAAVDKAVRLVRPRVHGPIVTDVSVAARAAIDETTLARVLVNLLLNAAEAYPPDAEAGPIELRADVNGACAFCDVTDHGPGIAPDVLPRLFEPFVSGKPSGNGMGLGLFVSRHLLRAAGGDLRLARTGPAGTVFRLILQCQE